MAVAVPDGVAGVVKQQLIGTVVTVTVELDCIG